MPDLAEPATCRFNDFLLDKREGLFRLHPDGGKTPVQVGSRALRILCLLADRRGEIVSQREIMDTVWPNLSVEPNNLTVQISALRRALDADRGQGSCIQNVPGRGYRFVPTVTETDRPLGDQAANTQTKAILAPDGVAGTADAFDTLAGQPEPLPAQEPAVPHRTLRGRSIAWAVASCLAVAVLAAAAIWYEGRTPLSQPGQIATHAPPIVAPTERPRLSLVVLPFERLGDDVSDHAVDAIVDDLITELSRYAGLRLTARSSAFAYKGKPIDMKGVGRDLGVRYALEGSARRHDATLAVNVQLVSTETGEQLWAEQLAIGSADGTVTADSTVRLIGFLVQRRVFEIESARSQRERPDDRDATDALIRAYALYNAPPSPQKHDRLLALYERAVALNPSSAAALGGLAETLLDTLPAVISDDPTAPFKFRRVEELLGRADLLDPNEMRAMIARVYLFSRQDRCAEVVSAARRTIEVHPVLSGPHQWLAICLLREGRPAEAVQRLEQAIRTNPRTPQIDNRYRLMGMALLYLERYEEAVSWFHRALAANPSLAAQTRGTLYASIAAAQALSGDLETARLSAVEAKRLWPTLTARNYLLSKTTNKIGIAQANRIRDGLRAAGVRDIANEDADAGVMSDEALHVNYEAPTPVSVPGARTIRTPDLALLLAERRPLVLDTAYCYGASIPGAVALWGAGIGGTTSDVFQERLARKMQQLTGGDWHMPIVTMGLNSERYQGRNLALRLVALGYDEVYWYRGGREAWVAAGLPAAEVALQDW